MENRSPRRLAVFSEPTCADSTQEQETCGSEVLQVGDLAKRTGKTVRAIHLYEDMGLLRPVDRSKGRYRLFNADAIERVRWISKLQTLGFSLPDIQAVLRGHEGVATAQEAASALRDVYVAKLAEVQTKLSELHRLERELINSLTYLSACQSACAPEVSVHACPSCERHLDQPEPPALVAGAFAQ
ncbi:MAG TPA: MerR family transcriptional regulator [Polyangiaceae bacterium]|nr:MerR family transcriptional regulator [Polyangiaceae bacterium]